MSFCSMAKQFILICTLLHIYSLTVLVSGSYQEHMVHAHCHWGEPCLNLSIIVANTSIYLNSNTTLIFQQGDHYLDNEFSVSGEELLELSSNQSLESASIICRDNGRLKFSNINQLRMRSLKFIGCSVTVELVALFNLEYSSFYGETANSSAIQLNKTNIEIFGSIFMSYTVGTYWNSVRFLEEIDHPYSLVHVESHDANIGGALVVTDSSNLTISNSEFSGNSAQLGGAIFIKLGSTATIDNCTFFDNSATNCTDDRCNGGALFIDNGCTVTAQNSNFKNNTSDFSGGAIALFRGTLDDIQNEFNFNRARNFGGSIFAHFSSSINSDMSIFTSNEAGFSGGVIYADYLSSVMVKNGAFHYNEATMTMCTIPGSRSSTLAMHLDDTCFDSEAGFGGGALYARFGSTIAVEESRFSGNRAENDGGVMYATSNSSITVDGSTFDGNYARYGGGVVHAYYYSSIAVNNSQFSNNEAENVGGIFHIFYSSTLSVENSTFNKNRAGYIGGVLHAFYLSTVVIDGSLFYRNNASYFGGVVYTNYICNITVYNSSFNYNKVNADGGAIFAYDNNTIIVDGSNFNDNMAGGNGGAVYSSHLSKVIFRNGCKHSRNLANEGGGVIFTRDDAPFTDFGSSFVNNMAEINGGSICINDGDIKLEESNFTGNGVQMFGGAINLEGIAHRAMIDRSVFTNNSAMNGAAISMDTDDSINLNMSNNTFSLNYAKHNGGALYLAKGNNLTSDGDSFVENSADRDGGAFYLKGQNRLTIWDGNFSSNKAVHDGGALFSLSRTKLKITGEECSFIGNQAQNGGAIFANYSTIELSAHNVLMADNAANSSGGALHLSESNLTLSNCTFLVTENKAKNGGAVHASESNLQISSSMEIRNNSASDNGGGIYLIKSMLNVRGYGTYIVENTADLTGGGLYASNSIIMINGTVNFASNRAQNGGGISMQGNDRLYGSAVENDLLNFSSNVATNYGGAMYVNDNNNTEFCGNSSATECFFSSVYLNCEGNIAGVSGADIFGGFLHQCRMKQNSNLEGLKSLNQSSNIDTMTYNTISSLPVRVCFCINGEPNCSYTPDSIPVNTEKSFAVEIIAYDQVTRGVNATFDCSLRSLEGLRQDQMIQHVSTTCTKLNFNLELITRFGAEDLLLSVRGPCNNTGISDRHIHLNITCYCPLGFQNSNKNPCECVCHEVLQPYNAECDIQTSSIIRNDNFWIAYIEHNEHNESTKGYLIYPNCPFDYCRPQESNVTINLNDPNGSDAQCESSRTGILCGTCQPGLSVSLGSSHCLSCPAHWPWLVVAIAVLFILAGIALVILLLVLNLTVAVGTLNAIIFYANIVAANRSVVFQTSEIGFATVLISWLNFDIGFDTCFYEGMDTYVKTWLQLAFPVYIILLVAIIIKLSNISDTFGHLIGKKDPVATLATLVLLSYTKFLQTIITAFSRAILEYPNGVKKYVWLPDATVEYVKGYKHAILFIIAILILLVGLIYTLLLFFWQWFLCCPMKRVKWIRNQKLSSFLEMYLLPYTPKHRYWTGLLLLVRVSVYLVSAFNPSSDPRITLSSTIFIISFLFLYIAMFGVRIYKCWFINGMETLTYFNLVALFIFTWYTTDAGGNQEAVTNISISITFIQLLAVLMYHICRYANQRLYSRIETSVFIVKLKKYFEKMKEKKCAKSASKRDGNTLQADELLEMVDRPQGDDATDSQVFSIIATSTISMAEMLKSDFVQEEDLDSKPKEPRLEENSKQAS